MAVSGEPVDDLDTSVRVAVASLSRGRSARSGGRRSWELRPARRGGDLRGALDRRFPDVPVDTDPWPTLLWATGRIAPGDRERRTEWRWDSTVR